MCGIAGILTARCDQLGEAGHSEIAAIMAMSLAHRGPDGAGSWGDDTVGVGLAHRRLAILDLTEEGRQPMSSACGRYILAFNGEIYNHAELRRELVDVRWRGHSDTEVLLGAFSRWGVEEALGKLIGMFALAVWDRHEARLYLARDRFGEKPLYYGWAGESFLFGSELKALRAYPAFRPEIDRNALSAYLRFGYVPAPFSIYSGIFKLPAGSLLEVNPSSSPSPVPRQFWSAVQVARDLKCRGPSTFDDATAIAELESLLGDAVGRQSVADVPLGAFLSGGIDSSLIVALMQARASSAVRTFTIGFEEWGYDEAPHAAAVARHLGTKHTEFYVGSEETRAVIPELADLYDEPFADSSQVPTHLVARLAREHVTVSLSGDGGDELFGGYNRYVSAVGAWERSRGHSDWVGSAVASGLTLLSPRHWDAFFKIMPFLPRISAPGEKLHKIALTLRCKTPEALYQMLVSQWGRPDDVVLSGREPAADAVLPVDDPAFSLAERMMLADTVGYLANDILVKVDRATMGVGLESRAPYLDHRIFEFAWRLAPNMKIRNGQGKWLLRQVLYRHVPKELIERPKTGFGVPIGDWLRGPLREWAAALLDPVRLRREGWFNPDRVGRCWEEHLSGRGNWQHQLWAVLMFQTWYQRWH